MKTSPTARTLAELRKLGYTAEVVEHWNQFARRRIDLLGFIDIVALKGSLCIGIQCTTSANLAARQTKIVTECREKALAWLEAANCIELWGWSKRGARGQRKLWGRTIVELTSDDFQEPETTKVPQ